jgi:hypothetical protein
VDANSGQQEHRSLQVYVYGRTGYFPDSPSGSPAPVAFGVGRAVSEVADRTGDVVEGGKGWGHEAAPHGEEKRTEPRPKLPLTPLGSQRLLRSVGHLLICVP